MMKGLLLLFLLGCLMELHEGPGLLVLLLLGDWYESKVNPGDSESALGWHCSDQGRYWSMQGWFWSVSSARPRQYRQQKKSICSCKSACNTPKCTPVVFGLV